VTTSEPAWPTPRSSATFPTTRAGYRWGWRDCWNQGRYHDLTALLTPRNQYEMEHGFALYHRPVACIEAATLTDLEQDPNAETAQCRATLGEAYFTRLWNELNDRRPELIAGFGHLLERSRDRDNPPGLADLAEAFPRLARPGFNTERIWGSSEIAGQNGP